MKRIGLALLVAAVAAGCGGGSGGGSTAPATSPSVVTVTPTPTTPPAPTKITVTPILFIKQGDPSFPNFRSVGAGCQGTGGYSDLHAHGAVTIYNQSGKKVVGTGFIKKGFVQGGKCGMIASVKVPRLTFYQVQWANRNKVAFSAHDLIHHKSFESIG